MVYAGASGVGTAALQIIANFGAKGFFTCSSEDKIDLCKKYLIKIMMDKEIELNST